MDKIITTIVVFWGFGIVILLSIEDISNNIKLPIVVLFILIAGYWLRRIQPKETKSGKDTGK
jgi:FtsH-binding integral membrane protein